MRQRLHLALAPDELGQPAASGTLQPRPQRAKTRDFEHFYGLADAFNPARAESLELEVALDELPYTLPDHHRARCSEGLQARGQADRMPDRDVFRMRVAG